jgi:SAM-dependent methyltransferase
MKRQFDPAEMELMDRPQPVSTELENDLRNLRDLNRHFGSYAVVRRFLRRWLLPGKQFHLVDFATGSGDIPRLVVDHARRVGRMVKVTALEQNAATLEIAQKLSAGYPEITFERANILEWSPSRTCDVVFCTLVLHHFSEDDAVRVLQNCRLASHQHVLVSDLRRGLLATLGVQALTTFIYRDPMTKFDARLSAERAFSFSEMRELALRAGWQNFGHRRLPFARQAIWI